MKLNHRHKQILIGVLRDIEHWAPQERPHGNWDSHNRTTWTRILEARDGLAKIDPARWFGCVMTPAASVAASRCYAKLQDWGLVRRFAQGFTGNQTTHLALTPEGERIARELAAEGQADA